MGDARKTLEGQLCTSGCAPNDVGTFDGPLSPSVHSLPVPFPLERGSDVLRPPVCLKCRDPLRYSYHATPTVGSGKGWGM